MIVNICQYFWVSQGGQAAALRYQIEPVTNWTSYNLLYTLLEIVPNCSKLYTKLYWSHLQMWHRERFPRCMTANMAARPAAGRTTGFEVVRFFARSARRIQAAGRRLGRNSIMIFIYAPIHLTRIFSSTSDINSKVSPEKKTIQVTSQDIATWHCQWQYQHWQSSLSTDSTSHWWWSRRSQKNIYIASLRDLRERRPLRPRRAWSCHYCRANAGGLRGGHHGPPGPAASGGTWSWTRAAHCLGLCGLGLGTWALQSRSVTVPTVTRPGHQPHRPPVEIDP